MHVSIPTAGMSPLGDHEKQTWAQILLDAKQMNSLARRLSHIKASILHQLQDQLQDHHIKDGLRSHSKRPHQGVSYIIASFLEHLDALLKRQA